jgi:predicted DNA-binding ribbon-helix-helix protein
MKSPRVNVSMDTAFYHELKELSKAENKSISSLVLELAKKQYESEDDYLYQLGVEALKNCQKVYTLEEFDKINDL